MSTKEGKQVYSKSCYILSHRFIYKMSRAVFVCCHVKIIVQGEIQSPLLQGKDPLIHLTIPPQNNTKTAWLYSLLSSLFFPFSHFLFFLRFILIIWSSF